MDQEFAMADSIEDLEKIVTENPGAPEFYLLADKLRQEGFFKEAIHVALAGLSVDSGNQQARLLLARLYFEQRYIPFAIREIEDLQRAHPESSALKSLLEKLDPGHSIKDRGTTQGNVEEVIAEADFDFDILEELEDD